jgi:hypothetical protein
MTPDKNIVLALILTGSLLRGGPIVPQERGPVEPGDRVRVTALGHCSSGAEDCPPAIWRFAFGSVFAGLSGLVIGSLVGAARGSEGWREVPVPTFQPSLQISSRGALRVSVSFRR